MHDQVALRTDQHRSQTPHGLRRLHSITNDFVGPSIECLRQRLVLLAAKHRARNDSRIRIPLYSLNSGENGVRIAPRVEHHEAWTRAQTDRHQFVSRAQGDDRGFLRIDPGAYVRRERSTVNGEAYRVWLLQMVGFLVAGGSGLSEEKERNSEYCIREEQQRPLEPVRFCVPDHG